VKRREFVTLLGGAAAGWPLAARAQQSERMRRVGVLNSLAESDSEARSRIVAFQEELKKLGWTEGGNVRIHSRWAAGDPDRLRVDAAELVEMTPDVILAAGTVSLSALQKATRTVPIVFVQVPEPVEFGFVTNLARPGGNITGYGAETSIEDAWATP
jgi:putative ABC transport system substrate-binding protein